LLLPPFHPTTQPRFIPPHTTPAGLPDPEQRCVALLHMHRMLLGVVLPTFAAAHLERKTHWQEEGGVHDVQEQQWQQAEEEEQQQGQQHQQRRQLQRQPRGYTAADVLRAVEQAWAAADAALQRACTLSNWSAMQRLLGAWVLLGDLWLLAKVGAW